MQKIPNFAEKLNREKHGKKATSISAKEKYSRPQKQQQEGKKTAASNRNAKLRLRPHKSDAEILLLAPDVRLLVYAQANENNIERKIDAMSEETPSSSTVYTHTHSLIRIRINS